MSSEVDAKTIKTTQDLLNKIIKKPSPTDKLLKRPPFRFLHDVVCNIIKSNGFMKDLYQEEEMVAENIKDKEAKIAFLQKAIDVTGWVNGDVLAAKPTKIVAGLEPDKTNQWLQALAKAVINKKDTTDAVQKVLNGEKPSFKQRKASITNISNNKKAEVNGNAKPVNNKTKTTVSSNERKPDPKLAAKRESSPLRSAGKAKPPSPRSKPPSPRGKQTEQEIKSSLDDKTEQQINTTDNQHVNNIIETQETQQKTEIFNGIDSIQQTTQEKVNEKIPHHEPSPVGPRKVQKSAARPVPQVSVRPPTSSINKVENNEPRVTTARPSSARPAPPKIVIKREIEEAKIAAEIEEKMRLQNVKPVENLITENSTNENDDDDMVFVASDDLKSKENDLLTADQYSVDNNNDVNKGSLVRQLVETKKELEGKRIDEEASLSEKSLTKLVSRDIEKLRQSIQSLSQCANPLGRVLDYLQEDIDAMTSELRLWQEEYKTNMDLLEKARSTIDDDLEPLRAQLNLIDKDIDDQLDKISITKANIIRNDDRLQKMITMINRTL